MVATVVEIKAGACESRRDRRCARPANSVSGFIAADYADSAGQSKIHENYASNTNREARIPSYILREIPKANASTQCPDSHFYLRGELFCSRRPGACRFTIAESANATRQRKGFH